MQLGNLNTARKIWSAMEHLLWSSKDVTKRWVGGLTTSHRCHGRVLSRCKMNRRSDTHRPWKHALTINFLVYWNVITIRLVYLWQFFSDRFNIERKNLLFSSFDIISRVGGCNMLHYLYTAILPVCYFNFGFRYRNTSL